jgi:tRNA (guanine37-N1)-methyltransferase
VGNVESVKNDSFYEGLLEFPQYTRPRNFRGMEVPEVLFSGDHSKIESWRRKKSLEKTWLQRPDLLESRKLSAEEKKILEQIPTEKRGKKDESD